MTTDQRHIRVSGIRVEIVRKAIKNLHVGVYPPHGRVRVAAPLRLNDEAVRLAVVSRLGWIRRQQARFIEQERQSVREMVSGESHYFLGRRYRLLVNETSGLTVIRVRNNTTLELLIQPNKTRKEREAALNKWYRKWLREQIPALIAKWGPKVGVSVSKWGIKRMKTRWGTCNSEVRRIWLNLELAKKPPSCLEYILVHELVHIRERQHNERFIELMNSVMPRWRTYRDELNRAPLAYESWGY